MLADFKPGQTIKCTVISMPRRGSGVLTIERLMRLDPEAVRNLRKAHRKRQQRLNVYNRGNRDWVCREICAKVARASKGGSWTMPFNLALLGDIKSVEKYLKIEAA